jgi:hypothetical protein
MIIYIHAEDFDAISRCSVDPKYLPSHAPKLSCCNRGVRGRNIPSATSVALQLATAEVRRSK